MLVGLLAFVGFLIAYIGWDYANHVQADEHVDHLKDWPTEPVVPQNADAIEISADRLYADYVGNEVAADHKYLGKILHVTGAIQLVKKDNSGDPWVAIWTSSEFEPVLAHFHGEHGLLDLRPGQKITVSCIGDGMHDEHAYLDQCGIAGVFARH